MRGYLEARLLERLWTELLHRASLKGKGRFREAHCDMFFAFSLFLLMPALVGPIFSPMVFIAELFLNSLQT